MDGTLFCPKWMPQGPVCPKQAKKASAESTWVILSSTIGFIHNWRVLKALGCCAKKSLPFGVYSAANLLLCMHFLLIKSHFKAWAQACFTGVCQTLKTIDNAVIGTSTAAHKLSIHHLLVDASGKTVFVFQEKSFALLKEEALEEEVLEEMLCFLAWMKWYHYGCISELGMS